MRMIKTNTLRVVKQYLLVILLGKTVLYFTTTDILSIFPPPLGSSLFVSPLPPTPRPLGGAINGVAFGAGHSGGRLTWRAGGTARGGGAPPPQSPPCLCTAVMLPGVSSGEVFHIRCRVDGNDGRAGGGGNAMRTAAANEAPDVGFCPKQRA